jgi:hypothetical protein
MNVRLIVILPLVGFGLLYLAGTWGIQGGFSTLVDAVHSPFSLAGIFWSLCRFFVAFYAIVFGYFLIRLSIQIVYELRIR